MPKTPANANRPSLRRNQASADIHSVSKPPSNSTRYRPVDPAESVNWQWQTLVSVPAPVGYAHPSEPQCSYDPVEGLSLAPDTDPLEKIRLLEEEVSELKSRLYHNASGSRSISPNRNSQLRNSNLRAGSSSSAGRHTSPQAHTLAGDISLPQASLNVGNLMIPSKTPEPRLPTHSPDLHTTNDPKAHDHFFEMLFSGWNTDLPDPSELPRYVEVFFRCDPCGSRVLNRPAFMASLLLPPRDPGFPHSAILHAICASASRWMSKHEVILPDGTRRDQFAEYHSSKTRQYIDKTMASGDAIFNVMQACMILSWYFYQEGRWVEVWIFAGFQTRVAVPLRLNYPGTYTNHGANSPGAYLAPPRDLQDLESRRRTWWMTIMFDRIASVGGWIHAIDERDLGTEFPLRLEDFEADAQIPSNPQDLTTEDVFTVHLPRYTDSFILLLKSVMLFGRVTDYNVRGGLRENDSTKNQTPFYIPEFVALDQLVCIDFLASLPPAYGASALANSLDTDLYMVHIVPHAATITLHNPYLDFTDPQSISTARCVKSARAILASYYSLGGTSLDITRLHPFVTICWYLAAVVQVQLCKYFIEIGDSEREATVWGEINVLRYAMIEYGHRSPIGTRQERLLQGLMREIVRLTAQKEPLGVGVGVPLYPFSHAGVFGSPGSSNHNSSADGGAPLPGSSPEEAQSPESISMGSTRMMGSPMTSLGSGTGWAMPDLVGAQQGQGPTPYSLP
ncbi:hypothetical protein PLICRDRAFT_171296 [Plicaturopsis crispa FD-325 SS-3]|nr:hypothetical protein PLICRDRAFT_171296 [Plicaturopsis crispa FD-325 SS-3]